MDDLGAMAELGLRFASTELAADDASVAVGGVGAGNGAGGGGNGRSSGAGVTSLSPTGSAGGGPGSVLPPLPPLPAGRSSSAGGGAAVVPRLPIPGGSGSSGNPLATRSMPVNRAASAAANNKDASSWQQQQGIGGGGGGAGVVSSPSMLPSLGVPLRTNQQQVLSNLLRVRDMVASSRARLDQQRVNEFLNACSEGNWHRIKTVGVGVVGARGVEEGCTVCVRLCAQVLPFAACRMLHMLCSYSFLHKHMSVVYPAFFLRPHPSHHRQLLPRQHQQMLQQGTDVNCTDYDMRTGLMLAASQGRNDAVQRLLDAGASVNAQDRLGSSALLEAVKAGHDSTIE